MDSWVSPVDQQPLQRNKDILRSGDFEFPILKNNIADLRFPKVLSEKDHKSLEFYESRVEDYEKYLHLTFETYGENETSVRNKMIDLLELDSGSKVLEIACGTGRDSILLASRLGIEGKLYATDISESMVQFASNKLTSLSYNVNFCVSNALHIPCPDNYFDAVYSFGALGEFSDQHKFFNEVVRVSKKGAKVVVGDENLPIWQRNSTFGQILTNYNSQFLSPVPFSALPIQAREVTCRWIIGGVFYLIDFRVGEGEPKANFDFKIPGSRGGTHRTRFYGNLEGVRPETKELALRAREVLGISMHDWLDRLIEKEALEVLKKT
jgi:ubiquinone/menaquinone biosynthesis C-methylase UbiE